VRTSNIDRVKKVEAVEKYKRGEGSQVSIGREYGVTKTCVQKWIAIYDTLGPSGLAPKHTNNRYSKELKIRAVEAYLQG
jgi:transposase